MNRPPPGEPTEKDKAKILQKYPKTKTLEWGDKEYSLQKDAPTGKAPPGDFVTVPAGGGKRLDSVRATLNDIGSVHDAEGLTPIPVVTKKGGRGEMGTFAYDRNGAPAYIDVKSADHPRTTFAHEMGHYLDLDGLGDKGNYASKRADSESGPLMSAIDNSPTGAKLDDMARNPEAYGERVSTTIGGREFTYDNTPNRSHLGYLNSPQERFARAYAQYIARKADDPKMKAEMAEQIAESHRDKASYPTQWPDEEFDPIERAFDRMFET